MQRDASDLSRSGGDCTQKSVRQVRFSETKERHSNSTISSSRVKAKVNKAVKRENIQIRKENEELKKQIGES